MPGENTSPTATDADATKTTATTEQQTEQNGTETVEFWKAKAREQEKRAKANADAAQKLADLEESNKTEAQKLADRTAAAEQRAADADRTVLRYRVGAQKGLPADLVDRLRGDDEAALAADADALLKLLKPAAGETTKRMPDLGQGTRETTKVSGRDAGLAEAHRRFGTGDDKK